jgi:tetratricopeptide (TPR) repeat protein
MDHANAMRAVSTRSIASFHLGDYAFAQEQSNLALRMARVMDNQRFEGYLLNNLAQIALAQGQIDQSWEFASRALASGQAQGFPWVESEAHGMRGDIFMVLGVFELAAQEYQLGAASPVPGFHVLDNLCQLGLALALSGDCAVGIETIDQAVQQSRPVGAGLVFIPALVTRAWALCLAGRVHEALAQAHEVIALAEERKMINTLCQARSMLAVAQLKSGQPALAYSTALAAVEQARSLANLPLEWIALQAAAPAARAAGENSSSLEGRMAELLALLRDNARSPELQPNFQALSGRIAEMQGG